MRPRDNLGDAGIDELEGILLAVSENGRVSFLRVGQGDLNVG